MAKNKENILLRLKKLGLIRKDATTQNLTVALNDILNDLRDNKIQLLNEFERIHLKRKKGIELSFLEDSFYKHMKEHYSKDNS